MTTNASTFALAALATLSLTACEIESQDPSQSPESQQAALAAADAAEVTVLLANVVGGLAPADEARDEGAPEGPSCPEVTLGWEVILDYGEGCVPDNGWTEEVVAGSVALSVAGEPAVLVVAFDAYTVGDETTDGFVSGGIELSPFTVLLDFDLTRTDAEGTASAAGDLDLVFPGDGTFVADGTLSIVDRQDRSAAVDAAALVWGDGPYGACALPESGTMDVTVGNSTVHVEFTADSPLTGEVVMSNDWWTWTQDVCPANEAA